MKFLHSADVIQQKLPHKDPFILVDRVLAYTPGGHITCIKNVTQNEPYFSGHFPGRKIMPGVLICEALAQACALFGILEAESATAKQGGISVPAEPGVLAAVNVKFIKIVVPGDQVTLHAKAAKPFNGIRAYDVEAWVEKECVCKGTIKVTARGNDAKESTSARADNGDGLRHGSGTDEG